MKSSFLIWIFATIWGTSETAHYGWNMAAKSDAEMICDGIVFILFAMAVMAHAIENNKPSVTVTNHFPD